MHVTIAEEDRPFDSEQRKSSPKLHTSTRWHNSRSDLWLADQCWVRQLSIIGVCVFINNGKHANEDKCVSSSRAARNVIATSSKIWSQTVASVWDYLTPRLPCQTLTTSSSDFSWWEARRFVSWSVFASYQTCTVHGVTLLCEFDNSNERQCKMIATDKFMNITFDVIFFVAGHPLPNHWYRPWSASQLDLQLLLDTRNESCARCRYTCLWFKIVSVRCIWFLFNK